MHNTTTEACLSVAIPAYHEEATLATIVQKVRAVPHHLEIVIIDDSSTDNTAKIAKLASGVKPRSGP